MHHTLEVERLSFSYPDGQLALREVSLGIEPNEKAALVGPNGAGKSTLMLHLNGILRSSEGRVCVGGLDVTEICEGARIGLSGYAPAGANEAQLRAIERAIREEVDAIAAFAPGDAALAGLGRVSSRLAWYSVC